MTRSWSKAFSRSFTVCGVLLAGALHAAEWEKLPSMPEPNGGFIGAALDGKVYVAGGTNWVGGHKNWLSKVHAFDPKEGRWNTLAPLDSPLAYAVSGPAPDGGSLLVAGGFTGAAPFAKMLVLDLEKGAIAAGRKGMPLALAAGGVFGSRIVIVGGTDDPANIAGLTSRAVLLGDAVEPLPDYPGKPFGTAACAVAGQELFIFGGANWTGANQDVVNTDAAYALSVDKKAWRKLRSFPYAVRGLTGILLDNNRIYLASGYKNDAEGFTTEAFIYDIAKDAYTPAPPVPYTASVELILCDGYIYCLGGEDRQKSRTDVCFRIPVAELLK